jgi:hypothetical protein
MSYKITGMFVMSFILSLFSGLSKANPPAQSAVISQQLSFSEHYELVKLTGNINNSSIKQAYYVKENDTYILQTEMPYHSVPGADKWVDLWRINKYGYITDVFSARNSLLGSVFFFDEYYIDWIYSGDRVKKQYAQSLDADSLSEATFTQYLNDALEVYFGYGSEEKGYPIYLRLNNGCIKLRTKKNPYTTDLVNRYRKDALVRLTNKIDRAYDWTNPENIISVEKTKKTGSRTKPFFSMDLNSHGWQGSYGKGNFIINHQNEKLNFSAFNILRDGINEPDIVLYSSAELPNNTSNLLLLELYGRSGNARPQDEIGMYIVRPKRNLTPTIIAEFEKQNISFGSYLIDNADYEWKPVFEGFDAYPFVIRQIKYFNGIQQDLEAKNSKQNILKQIPKEFDIRISTPLQNPVKKFKLVLGKRIYSWGDSSTSAYVLLNFDKTEISQAFNELSKTLKPIELVLALLPGKNYFTLSLQLCSGDRVIELHNTVLSTTADANDLNR